MNDAVAGCVGDIARSWGYVDEFMRYEDMELSPSVRHQLPKRPGQIYDRFLR